MLTNVPLWAPIIFSDKEAYAAWKPGDGVQPIFTEDTSSSESAYFPNAGADLDLSCSALGQPEPYVYWLKNMARIVPDDHELRLKNVDHGDSAIYTCVAQNKFGIVAKNFSVQVVSNDMPSNDKFRDQPKQNMMPDYSAIQHLILPNDPENTTVEENGKAILECKAKVLLANLANKAFIFEIANDIWFQGKSTWLKKLHPGEVVPDSKAVINLKPDAFLVIEDSETKHVESITDKSNEFVINRLIITKVAKMDEGMYYCVVNDPQDSRSTFKYAFLSVKEGKSASWWSRPSFETLAKLYKPDS